MVGAMIGLAVAALAADCPPQWVPSPNASFRYACHFVTMAKTDSYSNSLRKCVEVCGRDGGVPACFNSVEEQEYVQTLEGYVLDVTSGSWPAWFGLYRDPTGPPITESNELHLRTAGYTDTVDWAAALQSEPEVEVVSEAKGKAMDANITRVRQTAPSPPFSHVP